jgi:hypothetical protein
MLGGLFNKVHTITCVLVVAESIGTRDFLTTHFA